MLRRHLCVCGLWLLVLALPALVAAATTNYVTPIGAGLYDGSSWAHAFSNIQDAVDLAVNDGDVVYLKCGTYTNAAQIDITNAAGVTIVGGYAGNTVGGLPGELTNRPSVLTRDASDIRIISCLNSTATLQRATVLNGYCYAMPALGGGLYAEDAELTLQDCALLGNAAEAPGYNQNARGGTIYATGGSLTVTDSTFSNSYAYAQNARGGAIYGLDVDVSISNGTFLAGYARATSRDGYGGALCLEGGQATIEDSSFTGNYAYANRDLCGGAISAIDLSTLTLESSTFAGNYGYAGGTTLGGLLYVSGTATTSSLVDCRLDGNAGELPSGSVGDLYFADGTAAVVNCEITRSAGNAINAVGAVVSVTNSLLSGSSGAGALVSAGTAIFVNTTVADNLGWGIKQTGGNITVSNGIVWGNGSGGLTTTAATITYTCAQEPHAGAGNGTSDPRFVYGYYLSVNGLPGQDATSLCIDAGAGTAAQLGLDSRTTRTDGTADGAGSTVDQGWHYAGGLSAATMSNLTLYVDDVNGNDGNDGWAPGPGSALATITEALTRAIHGSTINIATGLYDAETLPLTIPKPGLTLRGTNRAETVIKGDGVNRLLTCVAGGRLLLEKLTWQGGYQTGVTPAVGAGIYATDTELTLDGCRVHDNETYTAGFVWQARGAGVYAVNGVLRLLGTVFSENRVSGQYASGAAVHVMGTALVMSNVTFRANETTATSRTGHGGALCIEGGQAAMEACSFSNNWCYGRNEQYGGAMSAVDLSSLTIESSTFAGNYGYGSGTTLGGSLYVSGTAMQTALLDCRLDGNAGELPSGGVGDLYFTDGTATVVNCEITRSAGNAINAVGAVVSVTNSLLSGSSGAGALVSAGTAIFVNTTVADNLGWGIKQTGGNITVSNGIVWGNGSGGLTTTAATITYTCAQEPHAGAGNGTSDPRFVYGYYLSVNGLPGQDATSLCIDAGAGTAAQLGLDSRTTRTDGTADGAGSTVDQGWHYAGGLSAATMSNLTLYVDDVNGNDGNDGWAPGPGSALATITEALTRAIHGSTINIATGLYDAETLPLTIPKPGLTLRGTNRAETVIKGDGVNRLLTCVAGGRLLLEKLTWQGGYQTGVTPAVGAGIYATDTELTLDGCRVHDNETLCLGYQWKARGSGLYAVNGRLQLLGTVFSDNQARAQFASGGAVHGIDSSVVVSNSTFLANRAEATSFDGYGGAVCLEGGHAVIEGSSFSSNYCFGDNEQYGGAISVVDLSSVTVESSVFVGNYGYGDGIERGGLIYLAGAGMNGSMVACTGYTNGNDGVNASGDVCVASGTIAMTNNLIAYSRGSAIVCEGGSVTVVNCTLVGNTEWGVDDAGGTVAVKNSIAWGNGSGGIDTSGGAVVSYSCSQEAIAGAGNLNQDPLFVDAAGGDYHLQSEAGSWHGGAWARDDNTSPCIDAADPATPRTGLEPVPHGGKVNIGAYGNTAQASKTPIMGAVFMIR